MGYVIVAKKYRVFRFRKKPTKRNIELLKKFDYANYRILKKEPSKERLKKLF